MRNPKIVRIETLRQRDPRLAEKVLALYWRNKVQGIVPVTTVHLRLARDYLDNETQNRTTFPGFSRLARKWIMENPKVKRSFRRYLTLLEKGVHEDVAKTKKPRRRPRKG
jgi:hypothetical protein